MPYNTNPYVIITTDLVLGDTIGTPLSGATAVVNKPHRDLQNNIDYIHNEFLVGHNDDGTHKALVNKNQNTVVNKISTYTITATDSIITCDATTGAFTINLPQSTGSGQICTIKKDDVSTNAITVVATGTSKINNLASITLSVTNNYIQVADTG